jgi:hypothetical protein
MINSAGIERAAFPDNPVYFIVLVQKDFSQITSILTSNPGDKCFFQKEFPSIKIE